MEQRQLRCDLVTNTYNIRYETIFEAVQNYEGLIKIGESYYFNSPFKGKLGCALYRGFSFQKQGVESTAF